jgi:hypothetical protein
VSADGIITTLAVSYYDPGSIAVDVGNLFVVNTGNNLVLKVSASGTITGFRRHRTRRFLR